MANEFNVSMYISRNCLVVPLQVDLNDDQIQQLQANILKKVADSEVGGVVIDLSGIVIIDSFLARNVFNTAKMASLLGAKTIVAGLKPEAVTSLIDLDAEPGPVSIAVNLNEGLRMLDTDANP